jgi:hypothetical protein
MSGVGRVWTTTATALVLSALASLLLSSDAQAGSFSRPVLLPSWGGEWAFGVNDRGRVLAAGPHFYEVLPSGRLGKPFSLGGDLEGGEPSIALDSSGQVVVGAPYFAETFAGSDEYHGAPACCDQLTIDSWQLGDTPPAPQTFVSSPPPPEIFGREILGAPTLLIDHSKVTALWTRGYPPSNLGEGGPTQLEEAFGQVGATLRSNVLSVSEGQLPFRYLGHTGDGDPVAGWLQEGNKLRTARGLPSGALVARPGAQSVPGLNSEVEADSCRVLGFGTDASGHTALVYYKGKFADSGAVLMMSTEPSGRFGRPRTLLTGYELCAGQLIVGQDGTVLVIASRGDLESESARVGSIYGGFGPVFRFPHGTEPQGWLDGHGHATIVYTATTTGPRTATNLETIAATKSRGFSKPRQIARFPGKQCRIKHDELYALPLATSPNGHAVFTVACEQGREEQEAGQYLIRYTP